MQSALNGLMIFLAMVVPTTLVSIMTLFMGWGQSGRDLHELLILQALSIPLAILATVFALFAYDAKQLYAATPQWMVFAVFVLLLLAGSGEVAYMIVSGRTEIEIGWSEHVPLLSLIFCSVAICSIYAYNGLKSGRPNPRSGRW